jgi:hypothetical protein
MHWLRTVRAAFISPTVGRDLGDPGGDAASRALPVYIRRSSLEEAVTVLRGFDERRRAMNSLLLQA